MNERSAIRDLSDEELDGCELCGKLAALIEVSDCDSEVGYHGVLSICPECAESHRNICGACR